MKNFKIFTIFLLLATLAGCHDTDDGTTDSNAESNLTGTWKLIKSSGGIGGIMNNFPEGLITWTFDIENNTLVVVNNNTDMDMDDALPSGNYTYTIESSIAPESCAKTIRINNSDYGCFLTTDAGLTISQAYADGLNYDFIR